MVDENVAAPEAEEQAPPHSTEPTPLGGERIDDPPLSDFVLAMTKSMSKTGYYSLDHPEGQRAMLGLFDDFANLMEERGSECSFQLSYDMEDRGKEDVALYDGEGGIKMMRMLYSPGAADTFVPKLVEFFHRQGLLSFTVGKEITQPHFEIFIERMTRPPDTTIEHPGEELSRDLAGAGVRNISVVFDEDRISGLHGAMPWRAEMALTRLRKDVRMIPMLANATVEEMRKIKSRLVDDILRGIQEPSLLVAVAQNLGAALSGQEEVLSRGEAEQHLIGGVSPVILAAVSEAMAEPWIRKEGTEEDADDRRTRSRMIKILIQRLINSDDPRAPHALVVLYNHGYIDLDGLGPDAQRLIRANALAEAALQSTAKLFEEMDSTSSEDAEDPFGAMIDDLALACETLIGRAEWPTAAALMHSIWRYAKGEQGVPAGGAQKAHAALETLGARDLAEAVGEGMLDRAGPSDSCVAMMRDLEPDGAFDALLVVLRRSEDAQLRHWAVAEVTKRAWDMPPRISRAVGDATMPWFVVRNLLPVLRQVGGESDYPAVAPLYEHERHQVRSEALMTMAVLAPERAMRIIERALNDSDRDLRRTAALSLAKATRVSTGAVKRMTEILQSERESGGMRLQASATLSAIVRAGSAPNKEPILQALRDIVLDKYGSRSHRFKRFAKSRNPPPAHLLAGVITALGNAGTPKDADLIAQCLEDESPDVRDAANSALAILRATSSPPPGMMDDIGDFLNG